MSWIKNAMIKKKKKSNPKELVLNLDELDEEKFPRTDAEAIQSETYFSDFTTSS